MKKFRQTALLSLVFLTVSSTSVFANNVSSTVNIQNNINSSTSTGNSTSKCHSRIEVNGQVTESDECGDIHVESNDGGSKVDIKNNSTTNSPSQKTITSTPKPTSATTPKPTVSSQQKKASLEAKIKQKLEERVAGATAKENKFMEILQAYLKNVIDSIWPF